MSTFSDWADLVHGPNSDWGHLSCGCHPNCGVGMAGLLFQGNQEGPPGSAFPNREGRGKAAGQTIHAAPRVILSSLVAGLARTPAIKHTTSASAPIPL